MSPARDIYFLLGCNDGSHCWLRDRDVRAGDENQWRVFMMHDASWWPLITPSDYATQISLVIAIMICLGNIYFISEARIAY